MTEALAPSSPPRGALAFAAQHKDQWWRDGKPGYHAFVSMNERRLEEKDGPIQRSACTRIFSSSPSPR